MRIEPGEGEKVRWERGDERSKGNVHSLSPCLAVFLVVVAFVASYEPFLLARDRISTC